MIQDCKNFLQSCFFPQYCLRCQKEGESICKPCFEQIDIQINWGDSYVESQIQTGIAHVSFTQFSDPVIQSLIHRVKYKKEHALRVAVKQIIQKALEHNPAVFFQIDMICPIPLHKQRLLERGFNQSEYIAQAISECCYIPIQDICFRAVQTNQQAGLSAKERKENMKQVFAVKNRELFQEKTILLVDDVYTTGATIESCAEVLLEAGAKQVYGASLARSFLSH